MEIRKVYYTDEFWGAKIRDYELSIEMDSDEAVELVKDYIKEFVSDELPDTIEIETDEGDFEIDPYEYMTDEDYENLKKWFENEWLQEEADE